MSKLFAAFALATGLLAAPAQAITVTHVGYETETGAIADRTAYHQVFEAEDLYHAGQYTGDVYWPVAQGFPWMAWFLTPASSESATFAVPTDEIVVQIANRDANDGRVLVLVDGVLVDTVDVTGQGDLGATPVDPGFYVEVTGLPLAIHTVTVTSERIPGCFAEFEEDYYYWTEPCDDLHLDFIAGRQSVPTVTHPGYRTDTGAIADRAIFDEVFEAEDLYQAGQYSGDVYWPVTQGFPWMAWFLTPGSSETATFTEPTDEIVVQIANFDANDGLVNVYVDGVLLDTVNVNGRGDLGATPVDPPFYVQVTGLRPGPHTLTVTSEGIPGCLAEFEDEGYFWTEPCDDLHLDFVAGRKRVP
jgi:hypothetical protein